MKIMIVDDEPFVLKLLARQLANLGYAQVSLHESAEDALSILTQAPGEFELVFCDLQMPGMDGVEFVRQLGAIGYRGSIALVSGEDKRILQTAERLAQAHKLDVLGILQKPVSPELLRQLMDRKASHVAAPARSAPKRYPADELQRAIANGELLNHYQPKVELATCKFAGVEALVRWQHARDGTVFPDQFIATAEEHGLIDDLTRAVLGNALREVREWQDAGVHVHVSVNVSMDNLADVTFPDLVVRAASDAGVALSSLMLEVTESRLMTDQRGPLDNLTRLRLKRVGLSIDDFGTGHSSLAQLRDIPFDELKMDRSFVHGAGRDTSLGAIIEASHSMARHLGMSTVAEGVEDRDDWDYLLASGCALAQGYFIGKPMPAGALGNWIRNWEERRGEFLPH
ncbi:MAG: EAL domain-containing protein [Burkholderiales bacterium]